MTIGNGCGVVLEEWWTYIPWSAKINKDGRSETGKRLGRKLSALELVGPLALLCGAPEKVRGQAVKIMVDNAGSVAIWRKGYSTSCELSSTLVLAMYEVSVALECRVEVLKVTRCSDVGSQMADALSKAEFVKFKEVSQQHSHELSKDIGTVPKALIKWINEPQGDWTLGSKILGEMRKYTDLL